MSSEIERNLELYGLSLEAVADGLKLDGIDTIRPDLRQRVLFDRAATAKDMGSIFVLDQNGTLTHDSRLLAPMPEDHSERDYFRVLKQNSRNGRYISAPWRAVDGHYIAFSQPIFDSNGTFAGAVVGTMRLSYFEAMFRELKLGKKDRLILIRENGSIVMRAPLEPDFIGRNIANSPIFVRIATNPNGSFDDVGQIDGAERLFVFQRVAEYPLILSYNLATEDIYAQWRSKAWLFGSLVGALCALNLALVGFLLRLTKQRVAAQKTLTLMAATDSLTGLFNRRKLDEVFDQEWRRALRAGEPIAILMLDADKFKTYNDQFGHQAGDAALVAIAQCLQEGARRAADVSARYGGEEFAVLLPGLCVTKALERAESIRRSVLALRADQQGRPDSTPTVSIGVASMIPRAGLMPRDLVKAADTALYEAKSNGRNRSEIATWLSVVGSRTEAA